MNNISRTAPIALIAGVAGSIGVKIANKLLEKNIQVIGVDNFSTSSKEFLEVFVKSKSFHLIEKGIEDVKNDDLPEVEYAYFLISEGIEKGEYENAFTNFLKLVSKKTRIVLVSSLDLYNPNISIHPNLKWAEGFLAKQSKEEKLNARIVRLANVYGPGMDLSLDDPLFKLVNLILSGNLVDHPVNLDILSRAVYVDDAVNLLLKVIFHGSTSNKLFDGSLLYPVKLHEIKQAVLDPVWYEKTGFTPTQTAAWPTPNLIKTQNELNWKPTISTLEGLRETVGFFNKYPQFKLRGIRVPKVEREVINPQSIKLQKLNLQPPQAQPVKPIKAIKHTDFWEDQPRVRSGTKKPKDPPKLGGVLTLILGLLIIGYGLIYPISNILLAVFSLKEDLDQAGQLALIGNLPKAEYFVASGNLKLSWLTQVYDDISLLRPEGVLTDKFLVLDNLKLILTKSVDGTDEFLKGINFLNQALSLIKGEGKGDLNQALISSKTNLADAQRDFGFVYALLNDTSFIDKQPSIIRPKLNQLKEQSLKYAKESEQLAQVSILASEILPTNQEKNYLVVLEDNRILRPTGGLIISTLEIKVKDGLIVNLVSNKASEIDNKLGKGLPAPAGVKSDLKDSGLLLGNVTYFPDFVESSKWLGLVYEKGTGDKIDGVIFLDVTGVKEILDQSGSLKLASNQEVTSSNLEELISQEQVISKENLLKELVNKLIFVSNPNWNNLITSITKAVEEKHIAIYINNPAILSISSNFNWTPNSNFNPINQAGEREDYLYFSETNSNLIPNSFNLSKTGELNSVVDNLGQVSHGLSLNYKYQSEKKDSAKFNLTVDLPRGSKVISAKWGSLDILKQGIVSTDKNIVSYSFNLEVGDKESKQFLLKFQDLLPLKFDSLGSLKYNQTIIKQLGSQETGFIYSLNFPASYHLVGKSDLSVGENLITSQRPLSKDQNYQVIFSNK